MKFLHTYKWQLLGAVLGALGGFLYWQYVGCATGACPLQSKWQTMVPYGTLMGYLTVDLLTPFLKKDA
jgi:Family of unknown function (DUF6132)